MEYFLNNIAPHIGTALLFGLIFFFLANFYKRITLIINMLIWHGIPDKPIASLKTPFRKLSNKLCYHCKQAHSGEYSKNFCDIQCELDFYKAEYKELRIFKGVFSFEPNDNDYETLAIIINTGLAESAFKEHRVTKALKKLVFSITGKDPIGKENN